MPNLDSVLKSRNITLPTKVCIVKSMVFLVVTCGCESWTIKKAERQRTDAFDSWCWRRLLRVTWTARRSVNLKGDQPWILIRRTDVYLGHLMWPVTHWKKSMLLVKTEGRRRRGHQRMRCHHQCNGDELGQALGDGEGQGSLACCSPWGTKKQTWLGDWTTTMSYNGRK